MNDDDLYGPKLTPPPATSPIVRGVAVAAVTVSMAVAGCGGDPGVPPVDGGNPGSLVIDAGLTINDAGAGDAIAPGVDTGPPEDSGNPGARVDDAGNPGLPPLDAG